MNQSWSIIIFGYNEEKTIASVIYDVNNFLNNSNIIESEILVVDDGSNDGSEDIIEGGKARGASLRTLSQAVKDLTKLFK